MITILQNATIFDGFSEELLEGASVVIEDHQIKDISNEATGVSDAHRVDCAGRIVMPGLIDAHIHACTPTFSFYNNDRLSDSLMSHHAAVILGGMLKRGFTSVRDAGGADNGLWLAIEQGLIKGPRLFYSGKAISQTGGHGDMRPGEVIEPCGCSGYSGSISVVADGPDEVRKAVREELRKGAHQIKIFASGGVTSPNDPAWMNQYSEEEIRIAVYEAATRNTYVMAHCLTDKSIRRCIEYGVRSIEHGTGITEDTANLIAANDAFVVPTLSVANVLTKQGSKLGLPLASLDKIEGLYSSYLSSIEVCTKSGVKLGLGADLLGHEFHSLQGGELALRGEVNTPLQVLRSATSVNAELLQQSGKLGCIAPGAYADILVLDFDPFKNLSGFENGEQNIPIVIKGGQFIRNNL